MCLGMPAELERVDRPLDDAAFFEPFRAHFHTSPRSALGADRDYLRLMFLKYRYRLGFEPALPGSGPTPSPGSGSAGSPFGVAVPHPTTLMKITNPLRLVGLEGRRGPLARQIAARSSDRTGCGPTRPALRHIPTRPTQPAAKGVPRWPRRWNA